jgi:hypothetical protein
MNYQQKVNKSESYLDGLLKTFQPFIKPEAVLVFAFEQYIQWRSRQEQCEEDLENSVPGK